jgi:3-oxoacyl-[acyl-carrier-protein] synthase III
MNLIYQDSPVFISGLRYKLAGLQRDLQQLQDEKLLAGSVEILREIGYRFSFGLRSDETLLSLAADPFSATMSDCSNPSSAIFQHCYAESAVLPWNSDERDVGARCRYFAGALLKELGIVELPYFCSFASGCAGFVFLCIAAAGILSSTKEGDIICAMADSMPDGVAYDLSRERILGSAQSSAFTVGRAERGYQLLGAAIYSSTRSLMPLLELVKRTVEMIKNLARTLNLKLDGNDVLIHYPNMFPDAWKMVTRHFHLSDEQHVFRGMAERAHCFGSDSVITLSELHSGRKGRIHLVVNYGLGLHLGVCALREMAS